MKIAIYCRVSTDKQENGKLRHETSGIVFFKSVHARGGTTEVAKGKTDRVGLGGHYQRKQVRAGSAGEAAMLRADSALR